MADLIGHITSGTAYGKTVKDIGEKLNNHIADDVRHITKAERKRWNATAAGNAEISETLTEEFIEHMDESAVEMKGLREDVDNLASLQIPEHIVQKTVEDYANEHSAGLATKTELSQVSESITEISDAYDLVHNRDKIEYDFPNIGYIRKEGVVIESSVSRFTDFIIVHDGDVFNVKLTISDPGCSIACYDANKTFIESKSLIGAYDGEYIIPNGVHYIRCSFYGIDKEHYCISVPKHDLLKIENDIEIIYSHQNNTDLNIRDIEKKLSFNEEYPFDYNGYVERSGGVNTSEKAQRTDYVSVAKYSKVACDTLLGDGGYAIAFFDKDKKFISGLLGQGSNKITADIPNDAEFAVVSNYGTYLDKKALFISDSDNIGNSIKEFQAKMITSDDIEHAPNENGNIFDKSKVIEGKELYGDGRLVGEANSAVSDFIPVHGKKSLYHNNLPVYTGLNHYYAFYDADKNPVVTSKTFPNTESRYTVSIPSNAYYYVFSVFQRATSGSKDYSNLTISFNEYIEYEDFEECLVSLKGYKVAQPIDRHVYTSTKKMLVFGDSITETARMNDDGSDYTEGVRTNWMTFTKKYLDTDNFKNYAKSGATYKDTSGGVYRQNVSEQIALALADSNNDDAEIVVVSLGTNDGDSRLGNYDTAMSKTSLDDLDRTYLYEALRWVMWTLRNKYANAKFFVGMPIQRASREQPNEMLDAIKKMANRYNFIVIDATNESGIIREFETVNENGRYLYDGLHPNADGANAMAKLYSNVILRNFIADGN